ncbi:uncharacterized protein [Henckelia pumila]|uniref:uncharacterized protein n=1 Tax=Henckelia pumila TaxID=405737 RepID=UPI003C6E910B
MSVHPGSNKMYRDFCTRFWWKGMKHSVYQYVSRCLKEVEERQAEGPEFVQQAVDVVEQIKKLIKTAQDRHASYANTQHRPLQFEVGEKVFLKVFPFHRILMFGLNCKLSPRYIGPFEILKTVGDLAYRLALPSELSDIHYVFHVSMLQQYVADEFHILQLSEVQLDTDFTYVEKPLRILDRKEKMLRTKVISLVLVQWQRRGIEKATWEVERRMRTDYPESF